MRCVSSHLLLARCWLQSSEKGCGHRLLSHDWFLTCFNLVSGLAASVIWLSAQRTAIAISFAQVFRAVGSHAFEISTTMGMNAILRDVIGEAYVAKCQGLVPEMEIVVVEFSEQRLVRREYQSVKDLRGSVQSQEWWAQVQTVCCPKKALSSDKSSNNNKNWKSTVVS